MPDDDVNPAAQTSLLAEPAEAGPHEAVRAEVRQVIAAEGLSQATIAREAGINAVTLSAWMAGKYQGKQEPTAKALTNWLETRLRRDVARAVIPAAPGFIPNKTSADIWRLMEIAQHVQDIAVFAGDAGIGKTTAIHAYAARTPNVWIVTCQQSMNTIGSLLAALSETLGIHTRSSAGMVVNRALVAKLRHTGGLLVMDEAQYLSSQQLDELRSIHDLAGVGVMLAGNTQVYTRFEGSQRTAEYAQLFSRIGQRMTRSRPPAADVAALLDAWQITGERERKLLAVIACKPGTLRGMTKCIRLAYVIAAGEAGGGIGADHILMSWRQLGGADPERGAA